MILFRRQEQHPGKTFVRNLDDGVFARPGLFGILEADHHMQAKVGERGEWPFGR